MMSLPALLSGWSRGLAVQDMGAAGAVLVGAALFAGVVLFILWLISRSIQSLRRGAERFAQGDLSQRLAVTGPLQIAGLAEALNAMAQQLQDRLSAVARQRNELGAVLSSMVEGVVVVDLHENILNLNRAAADLLHLDLRQAVGRPLHETVRNAALQALVEATLREHTPQEGEMSLHRVRADTAADTTPADRTLQVHSAVLRDADGERLGVVVVLHDVTHLRRLEAVRRDFVSNVSHEIRTPVSAIKAAVETLLDEREHAPEDAQRFLQIVQRQANRLDAIVNDLLSLARIEQESGRVAAELQPGPLAPVLHGARETCQANADARDIQLDLRCEAALQARINAPLLEQAVVNLIDNAIKYSPAHTQVEVVAERRAGEVVIAVRDQGRGIEAEHLPRVFERFYRTDRARSRALGGTGLGLSIVKHVAEAHGGRVSLDSAPHQGSTFRIHLLPADT